MFENKQEVLVRVDGLTQAMTSARVVETSITVTDNITRISGYLINKVQDSREETKGAQLQLEHH